MKNNSFYILSLSFFVIIGLFLLLDFNYPQCLNAQSPICLDILQYNFKSNASGVTASNDSPPDPPAKSLGVAANDGACFLIDISMHEIDNEDREENCSVHVQGGTWVVQAYSSENDGTVFCNAECITWGN